MNEALLSSKNLDWCTPQDFFKQLNREFSFVLDAAATDKSAKCRRYFTPENDGLKNSWGGGYCFLQPALWPGNWEMGSKGVPGGKETQYNRRYAYSSPDGYGILSRLHLW
jgi:hypothetical protein